MRPFRDHAPLRGVRRAVPSPRLRLAPHPDQARRLQVVRRSRRPSPRPGQLVGIVGPNGCGKSNVIDAVRWVLGESKASALRGESMQDVIFNGAGERKPVGRASVELHFDNSAGRIGGQWGQYTEISIKRVLTRDGDSTYYINNIPVRRRDIHDLFLGTGLGPRAYAIIEQGMISRVIEAKPEELRIFLEEAAGVSKYKERRKETEGRLSDTRENLSRVEDIRIELGSQLDAARAPGAGRDRVPRARGAPQADAAPAVVREAAGRRARARALRDRDRRADHRAGSAAGRDPRSAEAQHRDAAQRPLRGGRRAARASRARFYAANAEVTRLEQQLAFAREIGDAASRSRSRSSTEQLARARGAGRRDRRRARAARRRRSSEALAAREARRRRGARRAGGAAGARAARSPRRRARSRSIEQRISAVRAGDPRRGDAARERDARSLAQLDERRARARPPSSTRSRRRHRPIRERRGAARAGERRARRASRTRSPRCRQRARRCRSAQRDAVATRGSAKARQLADLEARAAGAGGAAGEGRARRGQRRLARRSRARRDAPQLWQRRSTSSAGWNDALEAVLRERLEALELDAPRRRDRLGIARDARRRCGSRCIAPAPARHAPTRSRRRAARQGAAQAARASAASWPTRCTACAAATRPRGGARRPRRARASASRSSRRRVISSPRRRVTLFAPDGELHGVLARQRELDELDGAMRDARERVAAARARSATPSTASSRRSSRPITPKASRSTRSSGACTTSSSSSCSCSRPRRRRRQRRAQLAQDDVPTLAARIDEERAAARRDRRARSPTCNRGCTTSSRSATRARHARNEAEVALERGRERLRVAERATQEAGFAERRAATASPSSSAAARRSSRSGEQQRGAARRSSRASEQAIDWTPVEAGAAAPARRARRRRSRRWPRRATALEALGRATCARPRRRGSPSSRSSSPRAPEIQDMQLKEQAAHARRGSSSPSSSPRRTPTSRRCPRR